MYEEVLAYITAIAPSLATVVTAILMFIKIIAATRDMTSKLNNDADKKITEAMNSMYAHVATLQNEVKKVTDSNEIAQIKEQNKKLLEELEESKRLNAELLAKLNMR